MCDYHGNQQTTGHKLGRLSNPSTLLLLAAVAGFVTGWLDISLLNQCCQVVADIFLRLLKLVSLPIIFFSLVATLSGMGGYADVKALGGKVLKYTLLTTVIAAAMALGLYTSINPASSVIPVTGSEAPNIIAGGYWSYLLSIIPSNIIEPFYNNNVMGVLFLALLLSSAIIALNKEHKTLLHHFFESLFAAVMIMTSYILKLMPLAVWAFVALFVHDLQNQDTLQGLALYLICVLLANIIQAVVILPLLLKSKGIPPWQTLKAMWPALTVAFFAKSSSAALPSAVNCAEKRMGVDSKVASNSRL